MGQSRWSNRSEMSRKTHHKKEKKAGPGLGTGRSFANMKMPKREFSSTFMCVAIVFVSGNAFVIVNLELGRVFSIGRQYGRVGSVMNGSEP
jgi:hypothetical protein